MLHTYPQLDVRRHWEKTSIEFQAGREHHSHSSRQALYAGVERHIPSSFAIVVETE
jgi:hypothetical protein